MKQWKYITGSEKDFEGAPDWATIYCEGKDCNVFYENSDFSGKWQNKGSQSIGVDGRGNFPIIAQREPIEVFEVWDGQGLPTVGTVCQWNNGTGWTTVNVLGVNGSEVWVKPEDGSESFVVNDDDFKPLPDERETAIHEIASMIGRGTFFEDAARIYNAGYRNYSAAPGFEWRLVCQCCGSKVEPGQELYHGCDS